MTLAVLCPGFFCRVSNLLVEHNGSSSGGGEDGPRRQTVASWLESIKMGRYADLFVDGGYSTLDTVAQMTSE